MFQLSECVLSLSTFIFPLFYSVICSITCITVHQRSKPQSTQSNYSRSCTTLEYNLDWRRRRLRQCNLTNQFIWHWEYNLDWSMHRRLRQYNLSNWIKIAQDNKIPRTICNTASCALLMDHSTSCKTSCRTCKLRAVYYILWMNGAWTPIRIGVDEWSHPISCILMKPWTKWGQSILHHSELTYSTFIK